MPISTYRIQKNAAHILQHNAKPEPKKPDLVDKIMSYECGELSDSETLQLFSELIADGSAWSLQGHYGRTARALINAGYIDSKGAILKNV